MPSTTFFNLPQAKRDKLMLAARKEFVRAPYMQASINKIIQAAQIPRGSFYMYFTDKEDLFRYLLEDYMQQLLQRMRQYLEESQGDLFQAFLQLYDLAANCPPYGAVQDLLHIIRNNAGIEQGALLRAVQPERRMQELIPYIDRDKLSIRQEGDIPLMLRILIGCTGPALCNAALSEDKQAAREHYCALLDILKRGMQAPEQAT